jgi:hypothetical protein
MTTIAAAEFSVGNITINSTSKKAAFVTAKDAISEIKKREVDGRYHLQRLIRGSGLDLTWTARRRQKCDIRNKSAMILDCWKL